MAWSPIWVLPNISLDEAVESEFFALVPFGDERVATLTRQHAQFRKFMNGFVDTFRTRVEPALILRRDDVPEGLMKGEAATSFRDLLVASMIPYAQSRNLIYDNIQNRVSFSTFFWVYPWMIDRNYEHIIANTPTIRAMHTAERFRGQTSPDLSPVKVRRADFDEPLLQALLLRFGERFTDESSCWQNRALFRSLNMANQASLFPGGVDATIYDFGRIIALWISAFEVLVHPGGNGQANAVKVFKLLDEVPWISKKSSSRRYLTGKRKNRARRNLACWVYDRMYQCRNDFLHGNPVDVANLVIRQSRRPLVSVAPILFRLGLTSFLQLHWSEEAPPGNDVDAFADWYSRRYSFIAPQRTVEEALQLSRVSVEMYRQQRQENRNRLRIQ